MRADAGPNLLIASDPRGLPPAAAPGIVNVNCYLRSMLKQITGADDTKDTSTASHQ